MGSKGQPTFEQVLSKFATWLRSIPLTDVYAEHLARTIRQSWDDPVGFVSAIQSHGMFIKAQSAWKYWCEWTKQEEPGRSILLLRPPRAVDPAPRVLPTDLQLRGMAEHAAGLSVPRGPMLWILLLSGLRIAEVCRIQRLEAESAMRTPEVTIRAKGVAGRHRRTWVPGGLVRHALAALLMVPWRETSVLLSKNHVGAMIALRKMVPGGFHPHDLRHAVARLLRRLRHPDSLISAVLGHNLAAVMGTTAIYAPPSPEEIELAHASIGAYLWPDGLNPPADSWLRTGGFPGSSSGGSSAAAGGGPPGSTPSGYR